MPTIKLSAALALLVAVACSKAEPAKTDSSAAMASPGGAMSGDMKGGMKGGMAMGGMHSDSVAARAQADLSALRAASADEALKLVPAHKAAVEALLADCEQMMKQMKMTPPAKWTDAMAAIRADLAKMSTANAAALHAMVPEHADRVNGMLGMRHDMMKM